MREQVELTFLIGIDHKWENSLNYADFRDAVTKKASELCGGCSVIHTTGYWMSAGASHAQPFKGDLESEHCLRIKLSCELDKEHRVYKEMGMTISAMADHYGIDTDWVHVQRSTFVGMHFSTKAMLEDMSRSVYRDIVSPGTRGAR